MSRYLPFNARVASFDIDESLPDPYIHKNLGSFKILTRSKVDLNSRSAVAHVKAAKESYKIIIFIIW